MHKLLLKIVVSNRVANRWSAAMADENVPKSFGVFKPVGYVLSSFEDDARAQSAANALIAAGFPATDVRVMAARDVARLAEGDILEASALASVGQELNLVKEHLKLAEHGHGFVSVRAGNAESADRVAAIAERFGADRAQRYGRFVVEELIQPGTGEAQVAESPSRGLDAQTRSGIEGDLGDPAR